MIYVIKFEGLEGTVNIGEFPPAETDAYLAYYDPDARNGGGEMIWTTKLDDALGFTTAASAVEFYRQVSKAQPIRPDGEPNRPLTAFTVSILPRQEKKTNRYVN